VTEAVGPRHIWLCADDYGIAPGVSAAIRQLMAARRLNATSAMMPAESLDPDAATALLRALPDRAAIGLHVTLTAPFRPLSPGFSPLHDGAFLPMPHLLGRALLRSLDAGALRREVEAQFGRFQALFGRPPAFVDGHQHVHLFPQIRDAVLAASAGAGVAWVRQCGRAAGGFTPGDLKAMLLDRLSRTFRARAVALGIATNPAFAGTYTFREDADFPALFPRFLDRLPEGGVVMCHPGRVDATLTRLDPLTTLRERELAFFEGDAFTQVLERAGVRLYPDTPSNFHHDVAPA
jgi:predicted glycoside hydrolase/deacetylase ChbG (UPF0249 family)